MQQESSLEVIGKFHAFSGVNTIPTNGIALFTVQKDRSTEFSSLVIDWDRGETVAAWPLELSSLQYKERRFGDWWVIYAAGLDRGPVDQMNKAGGDPSQQLCYNKPFCCSAIRSYLYKPTALDQCFNNFTNGKGHHPNIVFEVKCQRNNGPLLSTDHFRLENGRVLPVVGGNFTQKKHAFKNFKCLVHDLFYAVDVYNNSSTASGGYNFHHMRLNPYTRINPATLDEFFRDWSSSSSSLSSSSAPSSSSLLSSTEHTTDDDDHSS